MLTPVGAARPQLSLPEPSQTAGQRLLASSLGADHLCAGPDPVSAPRGMLASHIRVASHGPGSSALGKLCRSQRVKPRAELGQSLPRLTTHPKGNFTPKLVLVHLIHRFLLLPGNPEQCRHPPPLCSAAIHRHVASSPGNIPQCRFTSPLSFLCVSEATRLLLRPLSVS